MSEGAGFHVPGSRRLVLAHAAALLWLLTIPIAFAVSVTPPEGVIGKPGGYTALPFIIEGEGEYAYVVSVPEGWGAVTTKGRVKTVDGRGLVMVTVAVPGDAPAGHPAAVQLRVLEGDREVASARAVVAVALRAAVAVQPVPSLTGTLGSPIFFETTVSNLGNARDLISVRPVHAHWRVLVQPASIELDPGERASVRVTETPTSTPSDGYRDLFYLEAVSGNVSDVAARIAVTSRWYRSGQAATSSPDPRLLVSVDTGVQVGGTLLGGALRPTLGYQLRPGVTGQLSDYVSAAARTTPLAGNLSDPFSQVPSGMSIRLTGPAWSGSVDAYGGRYSVDATFKAGSWDLEVGGRAAPRSETSSYGVAFQGVSRAPGPDLRFSGRSIFSSGDRSDVVSARYDLPITSAVELGLGGDLAGTSLAGTPYSVVATASQSLTWRARDFEVTQTYVGVPQAGIHTVGLSGGSRRPYPYGARASSSYTVSATGNEWANAVTVFAQPMGGVSSDVQATLTREDGGGSPKTTWSVAPRVVLAHSFAPGYMASVGLGYAHGDALVGQAPTWDRYGVGLAANGAGFGVRASASYAHSTAYADEPAAWNLDAAAALNYSFGIGTSLSVGYGYLQHRSDVLDVQDDIRAAWQQDYGSGLHSLMAYSRALRPVESSSQETLAAGFAVDDFLGQDIRMTAQYSLTSPTSILDFATPGVHRFSLGVSHTFRFSFDTPDALVEAFGGRRGAEVAGTAFLDQNMDGRRDEDEPVLAGVTVALGRYRAETDAGGRYSLRVPGGRYGLSFPTGLSATLELEGPDRVTLTDDQTVSRDLAFAPVATLPVEVFYDDNRNGKRDAGEEGIPFARVLVQGDKTFDTQTDSNGQADVSGLLPGEYQVRVNPHGLPEGYQATSEVVRVSLRPRERHAAVSLGAARPQRQVVQTFDASSLAVLPLVRPSSVPAGGEVRVMAIAQGEPDSVVLSANGTTVPMARKGSAWEATMRIPLGTTPGPMTLRVRAELGGGSVERDARLVVEKGLPFAPESVELEAGQPATLHIETYFRGAAVRGVTDGGVSLDFSSDDGYHWRAAWSPTGEPGTVPFHLMVDGQDVGAFVVEVVPSEAGAAGPTASGDGR